MDQPGSSTNNYLDELMNRYYYNLDQPSSYTGISNLYKEIKREEPLINKNDVIQWLLKQKTYTLHRPMRINFDTNPIVSKFIDHIWNADLMEMPNPAENRNIKFLLVVIDNLSKFAWVKPLFNKTAPTVKKAFVRILNESHRKPSILATDAGGEFKNPSLKQYLRNRNIKHFIVNPSSHAVIVERLIRTLKSRIYKYFTYNNTKNYINILPNIVNSYNNTVHSRTKYRPIDVNEDNSIYVYQNLFKKRIPVEKIGFKYR